MNKLKIAVVAFSVLVLSACSSPSQDLYNYNDSNPDYSSSEGYYPGTLTEFVSIYQEVKANNCKRYTNDPTYVYTCETETLVITNMGIRGRLVQFCAYWANKEYCSQGSTTRW